MSKLEEFAPIFFPETHAVIGASNNIGKFGGRFISTQMNFGYKGKLFPVNPEESEVLGMKCYPGVLDIPVAVDFATILVPAPIVPRVLEDCLKKGIKGAQIVTAGFSERDEAGVQLEKAIAETSAKGIRVIGPNCFGIYCPRGGLTIPPGENLPRESGVVGCLSQSGGYAGRIPRRADGVGIHFSKLISYGNAVDVNECDLLEYFYEDPDTKIIIGYIEGVKNGPRFFELLKKVTRVKPVILWKGGLTESGTRAVKSHTASLSGAAQVWQALFKQTGVVSVDGLDDLINTTLAFQLLPPFKGRKFCVVGGGGGVGVASADGFEKAGAPLPLFPREIQQKLLSIVPAQGTSARNPVDVGSPFPTPAVLKAVMETVFSDTDTDAIFVNGVEFSASFFTKENTARAEMLRLSQYIPLEILKKFGKPVIMVLSEESGGIEFIASEEARRRIADFYLKQGLPVFSSLEQAALAVSRFVSYWEWRDSAS
jgi:acyl-CoA synthetase (NDP forming)